MISEKMKKISFIAGVSLLFLGSFPVAADDTTSTAGVNQQIQAFQTQLNSELSQANALYTKASDSQEQVVATQTKIDNLKGKIVTSEKDYASLKVSVANQLRSIQSSGGVSSSVIDIVASSSSLSDMIQRLTNLNLVMKAESTQAQQLVKTQNSLKDMKSSLEKSKIQLENNQASYQSQVTSLQGSISTLKDKISSNQQLLQEMQAQAEQKQKEATQLNEENAAKAAAAAKKAAAAQKQTASSSSSTASSSSSASSSNSNSNTPSPKPVPPVVPSTGRSLNVLATAYSSDNGLGYITAMGINLHENPMCIAVDPSVIPLGSMVEVPGYGIAVAGDTGGAIIGNHIDVHLPTTAQAQAWGAKNITIQILS